MLKFLLVSLGLVVLVLSYLPLRQSTSYVAKQENQLSIQMEQSVTRFINRENPEKRFQIISEQLNFDEAVDQTRFSPFSMTGHTGQLSLKGDSEMAILSQQQLDLHRKVLLQQSTEQATPRRFHSDLLLINLKTHALESPQKIMVIDEKQHIEADSLIGNYEEGWYEFTQHVKTQWQ